MHIGPNDPTHVEPDFLQNLADGLQYRASLFAYVSEHGLTFGKVGGYESCKVRVVIVNDDLSKRCFRLGNSLRLDTANHPSPPLSFCAQTTAIMPSTTIAPILPATEPGYAANVRC